MTFDTTSPHRRSWMRTLATGAALGGGFAAWWTFWLVGFFVGWDRGWIIPALAYNDPKFFPEHDNTRVGIYYLKVYLGMDLPSDPVILSLMIIAVGMVIGIGLALARRLFAIDPERIGRRSFRWAMRTMVSWPVISCIGIEIVLIVMAETWINLWFLAVSAAIYLFLVVFILVPFGIARREVVADKIAGQWWQPAWPGWKTVGGATLILLGFPLLGGLVMSLIPRWTLLWGVGLNDLISFPIVIVSGFLALATLMAGRTFRGWNFRAIFSRRTMGSLVVLNVQFVLFVLMVLAPIVGIFLMCWLVLPTIATIFEQHGLSFPPGLRIFVAVTHYYGRNAMLLNMILGSLLFGFANCRLAWLLDREGRMPLVRCSGSLTTDPTCVESKIPGPDASLDPIGPGMDLSE